MPASSTPATCRNAVGPKRALELQELAQSLPFRAVLGAPPRDGVENCVCAGRGSDLKASFRLGVERTGVDDEMAADLEQAAGVSRRQL